MSDQLFERAVREWLEGGSDRTPPPAIDAVLLAVKTTPQERDLRIPWRFTSMPTYLRLAAGIAVIAILGAAALAVLNRAPAFGGPGPGPSPTPSVAPVASAIPTQAVVELGTITLRDDGCTWEGNPGSISAAVGPVIGRVAVLNETDTFANFGVYRLEDGYPYADAEAWIVAENEFLHGGPSHPPQDFATDVGNIDAPERRQYPSTLSLDAGVHGIVCTANEPPPGLVFAAYLVGPLEVTIPD
jgi:hypothetical protein